LKLYHSSTPQTKEYLKEYQESFIDAENNPDVTAGGVSNANINALALILEMSMMEPSLVMLEQNRII
jgi:diketogulonate reductase-like aldo/keto reductase